MPYISVRNWRKFQHYTDRHPPWVKVYTRLHSDDDYLGLSPAARGLLLDIWLEYARSGCRMSAECRSMSRRFGYQVLGKTLASLNEAGYIDFVASAMLAEGYHDASLETETDGESTTVDSPLEKETERASGVLAKTAAAARSTENRKPPSGVCPHCGIGGGRHVEDCPVVVGEHERHEPPEPEPPSLDDELHRAENLRRIRELQEQIGFKGPDDDPDSW